MYKNSGKGLFTKRANIGDLKKKMDEAKNRTPEQKAQIKKETEEKRQQMKQQKKEQLDENLQLASLLAKKAGRTITKGSTMVDNLYKKVGIDVGMDKKREDAGKVISNLGKIGTKVLQGKGAFDKLRNDPKYQKLLEDVKRSGYHEVTTPEEAQRRRERELYEKYSKQPPIGLMGMKGGFGIRPIKRKPTQTPEELKQKELKRAEKMKNRKEMAMTGLKLLDKGTNMALGYAQKKYNKAIDDYGLERIGIKKDTREIPSIFDKKGSGFADKFKKLQETKARQATMTPEQLRKEQEEKDKKRPTLLKILKPKNQEDKELRNKVGNVVKTGVKTALNYADNKINTAIDKYGLEKIGIKKQHNNLGGFLPKEKQFFKVAKEEYKTDPPTQIDEFTLVYKSPTIHVYLNEAGKTILLSLRGTVPTDKDDLLADASIAINRLYYSNRFKKDKAELQKIFQQYPPSQYEYYLTGHSLGGAITNSVVREYPKNIKYAVTYNPAFQPYDLYSQQRDKIKRLYTPDDALYKLGGRFMSPTVVPTTKSLLPNLNLVTTGFNAYQGHALDNFSSYYGMGMPMPKKRGRPRKNVGGSSCGCMMCGK